MEAVDHPKHYGGSDNPYEAIKVIRAWNLNFALGSALKYIRRHGKKPIKIDTTVAGSEPTSILSKNMTLAAIEDLEKAKWYIQNEIDELTRQLPVD